MGWMLRLLHKTGIVDVEDITPKVPVNKLVEWANAQFQERLARESLEEEAVLYVRELNDKKVMISYILDDPANQSSLPELAATARTLIKHISLPEKITLKEALALHGVLAPELDAVRLLQEERKEDDIGENGRSKPTTKNQVSVRTPDSLLKPDSLRKPDPLQQELWAIQAVYEIFAERLAKSRVQSLGVILQKAAAIENLSEVRQRMEQERQRKTERQKNIHATREEKEAELKLLQQHPRYFRLAAVAEERQRLLKNLRDTTHLAERFTLKEKIDELEKSVGDKDLITKVEEARYRADHFTQQDEKLQQELFELNDDVQEITVRRVREIELFTNLVKMSLGRKIEVTVDTAASA